MNNPHGIIVFGVIRVDGTVDWRTNAADVAELYLKRAEGNDNG